MSAQLALRLEAPAGTPPLTVRAHADRRVLRADCDWSRDAEGWESANGWTIRPAYITQLEGSPPEPNGWAAFGPDGCPEWWAADPVTAMVRAEGGS